MNANQESLDTVTHWWNCEITGVILQKKHRISLHPQTVFTACHHGNHARCDGRNCDHHAEDIDWWCPSYIISHVYRQTVQGRIGEPLSVWVRQAVFYSPAMPGYQHQQQQQHHASPRQPCVCPGWCDIYIAEVRRWWHCVRWKNERHRTPEKSALSVCLQHPLIKSVLYPETTFSGALILTLIALYHDSTPLFNPIPRPPQHTHTHTHYSSCVFPFLVCSWEHHSSLLSASLSHFWASLAESAPSNPSHGFYQNVLPYSLAYESSDCLENKTKQTNKKQPARKHNHSINDESSWEKHFHMVTVMLSVKQMLTVLKRWGVAFVHLSLGRLPVIPWYRDTSVTSWYHCIIALFSNFNFKICPQRKTLSASVASYAINCSVCVVGFPQLSLLQENGTVRQTHWHTVINACRKGCVHLTNWTVCSTVYTVQLSWNVKSWITHLVYFVITPQKVEFGYNIPKERTAVLCCIHFSPRPL